MRLSIYSTIAVIALAFCQIPAQAQISVGAVQNKLVKISGKVYYTVDGIYVKDGKYYLGVTTDNRFDDLQLFQIGTNKDEAIKSLESIIQLYDTIDETSKTTISDPNGMVCTVQKQKGIGTFLDLYFPDCAGKGQLGKKVATTYIKIIQKYKEQ